MFWEEFIASDSINTKKNPLKNWKMLSPQCILVWCLRTLVMSSIIEGHKCSDLLSEIIPFWLLDKVYRYFFLKKNRALNFVGYYCLWIIPGSQNVLWALYRNTHILPTEGTTQAIRIYVQSHLSHQIKYV